MVKQRLFWGSRLAVLLGCIVGASACNSVQLPEEYITGQVVLTVDDNGVFKRLPQIPWPRREFVFRSDKDIAEFFVGDTIGLRAENIDFGNYTFITSVRNSEAGRAPVTLKLERILDHTVELGEICQTVFWNNPYYTPIVRIHDTLRPAQVVLTPVFNESCRMIGYEIRYGSTGRDKCGEEAEEILTRFNHCMDEIEKNDGEKNTKKRRNDKENKNSKVDKKQKIQTNPISPRSINDNHKVFPPRNKESGKSSRSLPEIVFGIDK